MIWYVILLFFNLNGDPIDVQKLFHQFTTYEDCIVFGNVKAGQQQAAIPLPAEKRPTVIPVCVRLTKH